MGTPVTITPLALDDLRDITAFIAQDNSERAKTFGDTLLNKAFRLAAHPMIGRIFPGMCDPAVREIVHGSYRIIYRLLNKPPGIFVLRFWHAARGTPQRGED